VWSLLLRLGEAYGWQPQATSLSGVPDWAGGYDSADGQQVNAEDARAIAAALQRAISDTMFAQRLQAVRVALQADVQAEARRLYGIDLPPEAQEQAELTTDDLNAVAEFMTLGAFEIQ
jgi:hypothetical protein